MTFLHSEVRARHALDSFRIQSSCMELYLRDSTPCLRVLKSRSLLTVELHLIISETEGGLFDHFTSLNSHFHGYYFKIRLFQVTKDLSMIPHFINVRAFTFWNLILTGALDALQTLNHKTLDI